MSAALKNESPAATEQFVDQNTNTAIIPSACFLSNQEKSYATTQAQFSLKGHALQRIYRPADNCTLYVVSRWGHSRVFAHWRDVQAFLTQIGGSHA